MENLFVVSLGGGTFFFERSSDSFYTTICIDKSKRKRSQLFIVFFLLYQTVFDNLQKNLQKINSCKVIKNYYSINPNQRGVYAQKANTSFFIVCILKEYENRYYHTINIQIFYYR